MNSMIDSFLKALDPSISIKVTDLHTGKHPKKMIEEIHSVLSYRFKTFVDERNGVIYVGKRT